MEYKDTGKFKRTYAMKIQDYSSKELSKFFDKYISLSAEVRTDK